MPTIDGLPAATASASGDELPAWQTGTTRKVTVAQVLAGPAGDTRVLACNGASVSIDAAGNLVVTSPAGPIIRVDAAGFINIASSAGQPLLLRGQANPAVVLGTPAAECSEVGIDSDGTPALRVPQRLDVGFINTSVSPTSPVGYLPIYDMTGTLLGYVPVMM